jgi:hypothetical protein
MQMAAVAYNLKKYMKFTRKEALSMAQKAETAAFLFIGALIAILIYICSPKIKSKIIST